MRIHSTALVLLVLGSTALAGVGCAPETDGAGPDEPLTTEEVGGAIDAGLSTDEDRRGPHWVDTGLVLPPGFPAELPIPGGASVVGQGVNGDAKSFVVLGSPAQPSSLAASWKSLLEIEGWSVHGSSESGLRVTKAGVAVTASFEPAEGGSRLRIVY